MRLVRKCRGLGFTLSVLSLVTGLLLLNTIFRMCSGLLGEDIWRPSEIVSQLPGWIGLFLPFAAFVGGLASHAVLSVGSVLKRGAVIAVVSYLLLAYGSPMALYRDYASRGADMTNLFPLGPKTPGALVAQRSAVEASPPETYSFRVGRPLERPPNWLTYLLHSTIVIAAFSILAGLFGHRSGKLTSGLSPPNRRNARWALGLVISIGFFVAEEVGGDWVRADPSNSGALGAWLPLVVPLAMLGILEAFHRRRTLRRTCTGP